MKTSHLRPTRALGKLTALFVAICLIPLAIGVAAGAAASPSKSSHRRLGSRHVLATASRAVPRSLAVAARRSRVADRILVARAKELKKCLAANPTRPRACNAARRALQRAGSRLKSAESKLSIIASGTARARSAYWTHGSASQQAPKLTVSGQTLTWTRVDGINSYVFVRKVPGQADQYSVVTGTSTTPPPVPGLTVKYSVRTAVNGSAWAAEQSITYPKPTETKPDGTDGTDGTHQAHGNGRHTGRSHADRLRADHFVGRGRGRHHVRARDQGAGPGNEVHRGQRHVGHADPRARSHRALRPAHSGRRQRMGN